MVKALVINKMIAITSVLSAIHECRQLKEWSRRRPQPDTQETSFEFELTLDGVEVLVRGTAEVAVTDDSDFDREHGYGALEHVDVSEINFTEVLGENDAILVGGGVNVLSRTQALDLEAQVEERLKSDR